MMKYQNDSALKFIKKPIRLDLRFEKSFAMAIKMNKQDVLELFPAKKIKSVYVSLHSLVDYKHFKGQKQAHGSINDQLTTPLHLAATTSSVEAVRTLIQHHNYDVNILINDKSFLIDLLDNSGYKDFGIL